jgi:hypothetical protein
MRATTASAKDKHGRHRNEHTLWRSSGTKAENGLIAIYHPIIGVRYAAMCKQTFAATTGQELALVSKQRVLHGESGGLALLTGAYLLSIFPQAAALLTTTTHVGTACSPLAGYQGEALPKAMVPILETVLPPLRYVDVTTPEAVVSLTETTTSPSTSPFSGTIIQAAVPHTGTTSFFCPPPPPEPEPYTTGQTQ